MSTGRDNYNSAGAWEHDLWSRYDHDQRMVIYNYLARFRNTHLGVDHENVKQLLVADMKFDVDDVLKTEAERAWNLWYKPLSDEGMRRLRDPESIHETIKVFPPDLQTTINRHLEKKYQLQKRLSLQKSG